MKKIRYISNKDYEKKLSNFLQCAVKRINQDQDSYDIEIEKRNLERDYGVTESEYAGYVRLAKDIFNKTVKGE